VRFCRTRQPASTGRLSSRRRGGKSFPPGKVEASGKECGDSLDPCDVSTAVAAGVTRGSSRVQQAWVLVEPQHLGIHTRQLPRDRDRVERLSGPPVCMLTHFF
jgi:hypothetical protein